MTATSKFHLQCVVCARVMDDADMNRCPACNGTLSVVYADAPHELAGRGVWRYFDWLPIHSREHIVSLGETETPLVQSAQLGQRWGVNDLRFKVEGMMPTGSYKDRIAAVSMARASELGKTAWAATSSGNAGAALSAYGVRAGLQGHLFVIEKAARAKIAQILMYGPQLRAVRGLGINPEAEQATFENVRALCERNHWMMLVTASKFNPFGMEGVKTLAYEICEQLGRAPAVVYVPVGGGGLLQATWKGFKEWRSQLPVTNPQLPKMVAVQGEGCAAVVDAWREQRDMRPLVECRGTVSGLQLAAPPDGDLALRALRESNGWAIAVPDTNTYRVQRELSAHEGLFVEPAAAITTAAVELDRASGRLRGDELVVCILTGIGFKVMDAVQNATAGVEIPLIECDDIALMQ
jgi:threonine synthase